jgi:ribosomal protein S18 acetylase RimI-like enzyme
MNIRPATAEHADAIADLHASSWSITYNDVLSQDYLQNVVPSERLSVWRERLKNPRENQFVLVAEDNGFVIGFACAFVMEHLEWGSYLENLHVRQSHHGRGIGAKLLIEVAAICEQKCAGKGLYLSVNQANQNAQKFYLKLGAENTQVSVWDAPDGSHVPTFRFVWKTTAALAERGLTHHSSGTR